MKKKVVVGMSGGVDSSVVALLLKEQGYDVIGVTMQIFTDETANEGCGSLVMVEDAAKVCRMLDIPHYVVDFKDIFNKNVIEYFVDEYKNGRTPNPCIMCNHYVKWEALLSKANELGAEYIATGHYGHIIEVDGRYTIHKAQSDTKDQSYVLYRLTQDQLAHTIFPLSGMEKTDVRQLAFDANLPVAAKKESQDICFIADHDYAGFIERNTGVVDRVGNFVDKDGNVLGQHKGITNYTVGQRKGLGIAFGEPRFVVKLDIERNEVVLGGHDELMSDRINVANINYMALEKLTGPLKACCKVRYSQKEMDCIITPTDDGITAEFEAPVRAPAPGQSAVFYKDDYILCGGIIIGG